MVPASAGDFAELIAYIQVNFQRVRIERLDHTPERSILGMTCYWGKYALRITEIVSATERKYRYYVFDGEYIIAGFDNAADPRVIRMKYGRSYKRYLGRLVPHLHLDDKNRLELTDEMTVETLVAWLCDNLPLSI